MEKIQKLVLDFTESGSREEYLSAYCGDAASNVVEIEVTPALERGEMLLCTFKKDGRTVDTAVVTDGRLVIPYSVLKETGSYTASFAVVNAESRLTSSATLDVKVLEDTVGLLPEDGASENQSFASFLIAASGQAAEQAVNGVAVASGEDCIQSYGAVCYMPESHWVRVGSAVIVTFGFYSEGSKNFSVGRLPFTVATSAAAAPVCHVTASSGGTDIAGDSVIDICEAAQGSDTINIRRSSIDGAVLYGTLVYATDDPFPMEVM